MMITASYFDGLSARMHQVDVDLTDGAIALAGGAVSKSYPYSQARLADPFALAPCVIDFADGARCEVSDPQARDALAARLGYRKPRVALLQDRWPAALLALVLLAGGIFLAASKGVPLVADKVAAALPDTVDKRVGDEALKALHAQAFEPSRLSDARLAELQTVFNSVRPARSRMPLTLLVVTTEADTPNALALPNGTIVINDEMVVHILARQPELNDSKRAALAGLFAHEIGHVEGRHALRALLRSSPRSLGAAVLSGDFSAVVARSPEMLLNVHYGRAMEAAADAYAIARMGEMGLPTGPVASLLDSLDRLAPGESELPRWLNNNLTYLRSHPPAGSRSARFRAAEKQYGD